MDNKKLISIVIPCHNEEGNMAKTFEGLLDLAKEMDGYDFEVIAVNDGSTDNTWQVIEDYSRSHSVIKGIDFMTNFGQQAGYQVGFDKALGDYIVTVSADLEIPLENIKRVVQLLDDGYDFVNTNRMGRWGKGGARAAKSGLANKIIAKISGVTMKDRGSGMKGFRRVIIENLRFYGDMHRFIPDYAALFGARMTEFDVEFTDREYGVSAYKGVNRTIKVLLDLLTLWFMLHFAKKPFKAKPGRLFGFTGALISGLGFLGALYLSILKIGFGQSIGSRPLLTLSVLLIIVGIQSVMMGLLGELMVRTYFESSGRKPYVVREFIE